MPLRFSCAAARTKATEDERRSEESSRIIRSSLRTRRVRDANTNCRWTRSRNLVEADRGGLLPVTVRDRYVSQGNEDIPSIRKTAEHVIIRAVFACFVWRVTFVRGGIAPTHDYPLLANVCKNILPIPRAGNGQVISGRVGRCIGPPSFVSRLSFIFSSFSSLFCVPSSFGRFVQPDDAPARESKTAIVPYRG